MEEIRRESKKLLKAAKKVFGDEIVVNAFIKSEYYNKMTLITKKQTLSRDEKSIKVEGDSFSYDFITFQLELSNGKLIEFTNSEWASIKLIKK